MIPNEARTARERPAATHRDEIAAGACERLRHQDAELAGCRRRPPGRRGPIGTCCSTSSAAAVGSANTAASSERASGTGCRFAAGSARYSAKHAVPSQDPQDGPLLAMRAPAGATGRAGAARGVDLAHHAASGELGPVRRPLHAPHELVPGHAREGVVALHHLQVRVADPREEHPHEGLAGGRDGKRDVVPQAQRLLFQPERAHRGTDVTTKRLGLQSVGRGAGYWTSEARAFLRAASNSSPARQVGIDDAFATLTPSQNRSWASSTAPENSQSPSSSEG